VNPDFWKGKKVLVTGHTGFKGGWLCIWLQSMGAEVVGYALPPLTDPSLFVAARVADGMTSIEGDILDLPKVLAAFETHQPEIVIHMAAQALVKTSYREPVQTFQTNVMGTAHLLEAVRLTPSVRAMVSITSDKAYYNSEWVWAYRENDRLGGHDPYSASKAGAEMAISCWRDSYFGEATQDTRRMLLAQARAGNVIGGGDWSADRLIPDIFKAFMRGDPVFIRSPAAIRPWQFVLEPLRGYLDLAEKLWDGDFSYASAWNFGPEVTQIQPVSWITNYIGERWGDDASWKLDDGVHEHEATFLKLDCTKAKALLGWQPGLGLDTTLEWIIEWYQSFTRGEDMRALTEDQIARYDALTRG